MGSMGIMGPICVEDSLTASSTCPRHNRLAGLGGALPKPRVASEGNPGLIYRTPLVFPARRPAEELAKPQTQGDPRVEGR